MTTQQQRDIEQRILDQMKEGGWQIGRNLAFFGELNAAGEYMSGTYRLVQWEGSVWTIEKLNVTKDSEIGRVEHWLHRGEAYDHMTALEMFLVWVRGEF